MGSDFGSHLAAYRVDRRPPSDEEKRRIRAAAKSLQFAHTDRIGPYDEFDLRFGTASSSDNVEGIAVFLSSYFIDDVEGNDGLDPEVIIAREAEVVEQFAADLARVLGGEYEVVGYSGYH